MTRERLEALVRFIAQAPPVIIAGPSFFVCTVFWALSPWVRSSPKLAYTLLVLGLVGPIVAWVWCGIWVQRQNKRRGGKSPG